MKNYILLYFSGGNETSIPREEINSFWMAWFQSISDSLVDSGNPFDEEGRTVTRTGSETISGHKAGGYTIIKASDMEGAIKVASSCPILQIPGASVQVYETQPM